MSLKKAILHELKDIEKHYRICGVVDQTGRVYALGSDTKVLSTIFELISRPVVYRAAESLGLKVYEAEVQNHYPDFTLMVDADDRGKIAIDVKTTYRNSAEAKYNFTLGGYTSFIREATKAKNIAFPFDQYAEHWVLGFCYDRSAAKKAAPDRTYTVADIEKIPVPFENVSVFFQEKWPISSGQAGSGNTTNIGSIRGVLADFERGNGAFESEAEFLEYWRGYGKTAADRKGGYSTVAAFRELKKGKLG